MTIKDHQVTNETSLHLHSQHAVGVLSYLITIQLTFSSLSHPHPHPPPLRPALYCNCVSVCVCVHSQRSTLKDKPCILVLEMGILCSTRNILLLPLPINYVDDECEFVHQRTM